ncbi:hypothetical protein PR202_ga31504 [Eleusine coracana subsp. coracana]|uniref:Transposase-associated domain-containing protein n=1 Tax=Eleusine coracana subsp. coracana TaxID=191504 RepID=A0AAV5DS65_ELECO|nr:hypothetical protein PR202_ga31504 [Eleusine coracana subsp. coracana]
MRFNIEIASRETKSYNQGRNSFLAFLFRNSVTGNKIWCPRGRCDNSFWRAISEVREHLICDGFLKGYRTCTLCGEVGSSYVNHSTNDVQELLRYLVKMMTYLSFLRTKLVV